MRLRLVAALVLLFAVVLILAPRLRHHLRASLGAPSFEELAKAAIPREEFSRDQLPADRIVLFITGQSNAGNHGQGRRQPVPGLWELHQGRLVAARDPLLGSDALGASPWIRFGEKVLQARRAKAVVFILAVRGGTPIAAWTPGSVMYQQSLAAVLESQRLNIPITHVLWHQGESDCPPFRQTSAASYQAAFQAYAAALRNNGVSAPIFVAWATRYAEQTTPSIRAAQASLADERLGVFAGPDLDAISTGRRYDGVHFTGRGLDDVAGLWLNSLFPNHFPKSIL